MIKWLAKTPHSKTVVGLNFPGRMDPYVCVCVAVNACLSPCVSPVMNCPGCTLPLPLCQLGLPPAPYIPVKGKAIKALMDGKECTALEKHFCRKQSPSITAYTIAICVRL